MWGTVQTGGGQQGDGGEGGGLEAEGGGGLKGVYYEGVARQRKVDYKKR